jgi:outer membrane protein assembly factor BamB
MLGNDAQHTGVNGAEQGKPPMIAEWTAQVALTSALSPVAVENGRVFVSYGGGFGATSPVVALNVADGSALWTYNFGAVDDVGYPSAVDGVVYLQTNHGTQGSSYLWAIDAVGGTVGWASVFGSQWEHFWPPLVVGGSVYVDGGSYGGLYGFSAADGSQIFFNSTIGQYDSWSAAYFGGNLYTFVDGTFQSESASTGVASGSVSVTWNWDGYSMVTAPVFGPSLGYIIAPPTLIAINPTTNTVAWSANGSYTGMAAVADGVVYGISGGNLIARDASLGTLLWVFVGDESLSFPPVIANGYVYVSSGNNTYAVDIATHASVWTAPVGGWLAVASQRLVVSGTTGTLHGFVLSHP